MSDHVPHFCDSRVYRAAVDHCAVWVMWDEIDAADPERIMALAMAYRDALGVKGDPSIMERFDAMRASLRGLYNGREPGPGDYLADSGVIKRLGKGIADLSWVLGTMSVKLAELALVTKTNWDEISHIITQLDDTLMNAGDDPGFLDGDMYNDACKRISVATGDITGFYDDWERALEGFYDLLNDPRFNQVYIENIDPGVGNVNGVPAPDRFPPHGVTDPAAILAAWNKLSSQEQNVLIHNNPEMIGNLAGVPCWVRDQANHIVLDKDVNEANAYFAEHGVTVNDLMKNSNLRDRYKNPPASKYINALMTQTGLRDQQDRLDNAGLDKPVLLLKYDPSALGWRGGVVTSIGDPDKARNVAVIVPGTGNSVFNGYLSSSDIVNAAHEFTAADKNTAIITCMDYRTPDSPFDPRIASTGLAHGGADRIKDDVNALWATHQGDAPHMTVIGHSYGATTVADACHDGMHTNDVIFLGSPGLDQAGNEHGLHLDHGHMYVGANSNDVVTYLSGFSLGNDPAALEGGGIRFHAESPDIHDPITDHSRYFDKGSESLYSMADIVSGHGDQLGQHGMLTQARDEPPMIDIPLEILGPLTQDLGEFLHSAHNDHYHNPGDKNASW